MLEPVSEEETDIGIWMVSIIKGKSTMHRFERFAAVERKNEIVFRPTGDKEYEWQVIFIF